MIQSGAQHRGWPPDILRCTKYDDRAGRSCLIMTFPDKHSPERYHPGKQHDPEQRERQTCPERTTRWHQGEASRRSRRREGCAQLIAEAQDRKPEHVKADSRVASQIVVQSQSVDKGDGGIPDELRGNTRCEPKSRE